MKISVLLSLSVAAIMLAIIGCKNDNNSLSRTPPYSAKVVSQDQSPQYVWTESKDYYSRNGYNLTIQRVLVGTNSAPNGSLIVVSKVIYRRRTILADVRVSDDIVREKITKPDPASKPPTNTTK